MRSQIGTALLPVLLIALLSGCASPGPAAPDNPAATNEVPDVTAPVTANVTAKEVPIDVWLMQTMSPSGTVCNPATPSECARFHYVGNFEVSGTWTGTMPYAAYYYFNETTEKASFVYEPGIFTGTIAGCGSGSFSVIGRGDVESVPTPQGVHGQITVELIPGTQSTGMAGVVDVQGKVDDYVGPRGFNFHMLGVMHCL